MSQHTPKVRRYSHPGSSRRHTKSHPKGRQVNIDALGEIQALLDNRARQRDLLIEYLHLIQDKYGCLSAAHLAALAQEMRLALAEVYEVATFYAHFDVIKDGEAPPKITVRVCDSLTCEMMGAQALLADLPVELGPTARVVRAPCMGRCDTAPVAEVGHHQVDHATASNVTEAV
ncbi:MAG: NAD(P)H-dependent oxidoreductase subunit E, partial [Acidiferrobacterales bacterium]